MRRKLERGDLEWMRVPPEYWHATLPEVPESIRETVRRYAAGVADYVSRPVGLLFTGPVGVGKTSAAVVLAKEARSACKSVLFVPVWELREDIRNRITFDDAHSMLERCRRVDLLVLDGLKPEDAGTMFFGAKELEELVASRSSHRRATFLTTRSALPDLRAKGFSALLDAMTGTVVPVEVRGPNRRLEQHEALMKVLVPAGPPGGSPGKG